MKKTIIEGNKNRKNKVKNKEQNKLQDTSQNKSVIIINIKCKHNNLITDKIQCYAISRRLA